MISQNFAQPSAAGLPRNLPETAALARVRARFGCESGQALPEFALVAAVFLLILFGITQFGLALNSANDETHLANLVARYAAVNYNPAPNGQSLTAWALSQADNTILSGGGTISITCPGGATIGQPVTVTVSTTVHWQPVYGLARLLRVSFPSSTVVTGTATMRLEAVPTVYLCG